MVDLAACNVWFVEYDFHRISITPDGAAKLSIIAKYDPIWLYLPLFCLSMETALQIPFFFIIGRPRTGTTLLRSLFDAHPNVEVPWECQFVLNLYPHYGKITHWTIEDLDRFYADLVKQWQFSAWNIDHLKLQSDLHECAGETTYAMICQVVYLNHISFYPKEKIRLIGDKNHGYTIYTHRIKKLFPDAKFVYILRDYRDNYQSVKNVDFELPIVSLVVYKWKYFYRKALEASAKFPGSFYFIRYEDLVTEPELHLRRLCEFLDIPFVPEVFEFYKAKEKAEEKYPTDILKKHHKSLFNPVNTSRIGLWEKSMTTRQIRIADQVAGKCADRAGYDRKFKGFSLWIAFLALPGICYARFLYFMTSVIDKLPYRLREKLLSQGPLWIAKTFLRLFRKAS
jgi:hypothetical protein